MIWIPSRVQEEKHRDQRRYDEAEAGSDTPDRRKTIHPPVENAMRNSERKIEMRKLISGVQSGKGKVSREGKDTKKSDVMMWSGKKKRWKL
jgi:hypothetical protein